MHAMNMPGFTAEASLYNSNSRFRMSAINLATSLHGQIEPSLSRVWGAICASAATGCTDGCAPRDGACRSSCVDFLFDCFKADPWE
jgi:hypothetical protein